MKSLYKIAVAMAALIIWKSQSSAQTIDIGPNEYAFQYTLDPDFGLFFNQSSGRYEFLNGTASPVVGFNANTGNFTTNLGFESGSDLLIGNNRYAFRAASNPNFGLFFSANTTEYQLLNSSALATFAVHANNGNVRTTGGMRIGNSFVNEPGNIRWNGSDFQGYTGSGWTTLTGGSVGPQGPQGPAGPAGATGPQGPAGPQGDSSWLTDGPLAYRTGPVTVGANSIEPGISFQVSGEMFLQSNLGSFNIGFPDNGNQWSIATAGSGADLLFQSKESGSLGASTRLTLTQAGDLQMGGNATIGTDLTIGNKITVQNTPADSVGVDLPGNGNFYKSGGWAFGDSDGVTGSFFGDYIMSYFGDMEYIFWTSYFSPVLDDSKTLGRSTTRWSQIYSTNGSINTSDAREKKNIKEIDYGLETLMELKPVSYEWKEDNMNVGTKLGFVAQDLLETVPEVVVTKQRVEDRETGVVSYEEAERMGVFYDDLIPVLTKAIQEQQGTIEELSSENEELKDRLESVLYRMDKFEQDLQTCCFNSQSETSTAGSSESSDAELGQNIPNPFSESTLIRYYLPDGSQNAIIRITDMEGSPVEDIRLGEQKGANQVEFQTQGLAAGTYLYSLFVDGKFVDTKKMMIAR